MTAIIYRGTGNDGVKSDDLSGIIANTSSYVANEPLKKTTIDSNFKAISDDLESVKSSIESNVSTLEESISSSVSTLTDSIDALTSAHNADIGDVTSSISAVDSKFTKRAEDWDALTKGGTKTPVYISKGQPVALSATVGSTTSPVYLNGGEVTACGSSLNADITGNAATASKINTKTAIGSTDVPVYVDSTGALKSTGISLSGLLDGVVDSTGFNSASGSVVLGNVVIAWHSYTTSETAHTMTYPELKSAPAVFPINEGVDGIQIGTVGTSSLAYVPVISTDDPVPTDFRGKILIIGVAK